MLTAGNGADEGNITSIAFEIVLHDNEGWENKKI
jgi:hypothetical protein